MTVPGRAPSPPGTRHAPPPVTFRPPRFGLDGSPFGGTADPDGDATALATIEAAYGAGIRFFDTAPEFGMGRSERRLGTALARHPRSEYLVSTRVGSLVMPDGLRPDYSAAGIRRSLAQSLERLGLESVDLVHISDPAEHWQQAIEEARPALDELREQGVVRAIGVAMDQWQPLDRFIREAQVDAVLLSDQYSLMDQSAEPLLHACLTRGVAAIVYGVQNPEVAWNGQPGDGGQARARKIIAVCEQYGVSLPQAALAFPARHPAVSSVLISAASAAELRAYAALVRKPMPPELWRDLEAQELVTKTTTGLGG
ncbi:MAG TPA: aldo/keto reductase [Kribbella sp.]|nr:aldo/keto reductase [Kribbella sp.]